MRSTASRLPPTVIIEPRRELGTSGRRSGPTARFCELCHKEVGRVESVLPDSWEVRCVRATSPVDPGLLKLAHEKQKTGVASGLLNQPVTA